MSKKPPKPAPELTRLKDHFDALLHGESDRGAAIVGAALIEDAMLELVRVTFNPTQSKGLRLLTQAGSFAGLVEHAFAMGFISEIEQAEADKVRWVRNSAAHAMTPGAVWTFPATTWEQASPPNSAYSDREHFSFVVAGLGAAIFRRVERARELVASDEIAGREKAIAWLMETVRTPWDQTTYLALRDAPPPSDDDRLR